MKNNETEFANQDEEISYKEMWLDYKKRVKEVQEEAEQSAIRLIKTHDDGLALEELEIAFAYQMALEDMESIEKEYMNPELLNETVGERIMRMMKEDLDR